MQNISDSNSEPPKTDWKQAATRAKELIDFAKEMAETHHCIVFFQSHMKRTPLNKQNPTMVKKFDGTPLQYLPGVTINMSKIEKG